MRSVAEGRRCGACRIATLTAAGEENTGSHPREHAARPSARTHRTTSPGCPNDPSGPLTLYLLRQHLPGLEKTNRFNYDYSEEELAEIAARIVDLSKAVPVVHAVMNNNYEDQGQRNAQTLKALLNHSPLAASA